MPDVPPPEECEVVVLTPPGVGSFKHVAEHRAAAPPLPLSGAADAELSVWLRMTEERPLDALSACFLADAAPPALLATLTEFAPIPSAEIRCTPPPAVFGGGVEPVAARGATATRGGLRRRTVSCGRRMRAGALSRQLRRVL